VTDAVRSLVYLAGGVPGGIALGVLLAPDPTGVLPLAIGLVASLLVAVGLARVDPLADAA
jgi:hypothetical protein